MKSKTLKYSEVDHNWYESDNCAYAMSNNNSLYFKKEHRTKTWSVHNKTSGKKLFEGPNKKSAKEWIENKTGKKVIG